MRDELPSHPGLQPIAGDDRLGRYHLLGVVGRGGMAEVLLARQDGPAGFQKLVVVKRILGAHNRDPRFIEMFQREARVAAALSHTNIVQVFELGDANGLPYIVMEYVRGLTLLKLARTLHQAHEPMPVEVALTAISDAALGLHHAHSLTADDGTSLGLVHRDISPDNLIINAEAVTKILDFGIAKGTGNREGTSSGDTKGKIPYMAPEQVRGEPVDGRADLYALGVTLYLLLTGRRPFRGKTDFELMQLVVSAMPPRPSSIAPAIPPRVDELVMSLLEKDKERRPTTGDDVHAALVPFLPPRREVVPLIADAIAGRVAERTVRVPLAPSATASAPDDAKAADQSDDDLAPAQPLTAALSKVWSAEAATGGTVDRPAALLVPATRRRTAWMMVGVAAVAAMSIPLAVVVVASGTEADVVVVATRDPPPAPDPGPPRVVAPPEPASPPPEPEPVAPPPPEPAPDPSPAPRRRPASATTTPAPASAALTTVQVFAPSSIAWFAAGKLVGRGTTTLRVPAKVREVVAKHSARGVETDVQLTGEPIRYEQLPLGTLDVRIFPNGRVYAGKEELGDAPLKMDVVIGRYRLVLRNGDREHFENVVVSAGKTTPVRVHLE